MEKECIVSMTVLLELKFKSERVEEGVELFRHELLRTRSFAGCESVEVVRDQADLDRLIFVERWSSVEAYEAYGDWRATDGAITDLAEMLDAPPIMRRAEPVQL